MCPKCVRNVRKLTFLPRFGHILGQIFDTVLLHFCYNRKICEKKKKFIKNPKIDNKKIEKFVKY